MFVHVHVYVPLSVLKSMSALTSSLVPPLLVLTLAVVLATLPRPVTELVKPVLLAVELDKLVGGLAVDRLSDLSSNSICSKTSILDLI